jgi:hypothetical protein
MAAVVHASRAIAASRELLARDRARDAEAVSPGLKHGGAAHLSHAMRLEAPQEVGASSNLYFGTSARGASGIALAAAEGGELDAPSEGGARSGNARDGGAHDSRGSGGSARGARASSTGTASRVRAATLLGRIATALRGTPAGAEGDSARASAGSSEAAADELAASPPPRVSRAWLASLTVSNALTAWPGVRALRHAL